MKLVQILARELKEWPVDVAVMLQNERGKIECNRTRSTFTYINGTWRDDKCHATWGSAYGFELSTELADDWKTAIVTREMWEEARDKMRILKTPAKDKLEGKVKAPKANKDGWIRHRGGKCPVEAGTLVDVRLRNGEIMTGVEAITGWADEWSHDGLEYDTMAWRPHVATTEQSSEVVQDVPEHMLFGHATADAYDKHMQTVVGTEDDFKPTAAETESARKFFEGPLQWRDRIHAIDAEQKAADEAHKAATDARTAERAELVQKLAGEGLALLDKCHALMDGVEERHGAPVKNMNDPANWKEGDQVEIIWSSNDAWTKRAGLIGTVQKESTGKHWMLNFNGKAENWCCDPSNCTFKWHSRPAA